MRKYIHIIMKWLKTVNDFVLDLLYPEIDDDTSDNDISKFL